MLGQRLKRHQTVSIFLVLRGSNYSNTLVFDCAIQNAAPDFYLMINLFYHLSSQTVLW